jgi:PilZ domain-containing protein
MKPKEYMPKRIYSAPDIRRLTPQDASSRFDAPNAQPVTEESFRMQALVLTQDEEVFRVFRMSFLTFQIAARHCARESDIQAELSANKFEAIVLDFDNFAGALPDWHSLHQNHANKHMVVFAIATGATRSSAAEYGASFIFDRPLEPVRIAQVVRTAYGIMLRDRREYFRLTIQLPVLLRPPSGRELQCETINLSKNGMAVHTPSPFRICETLQFSLTVYEIAESVYGNTEVIWDDGHGKAGLKFQGGAVKAYARFSAWLDDCFYSLYDLANM